METQSPPSLSSPVPANPSRTWEVLCHVASLTAYIGVPLGNIIGPLIVWAMKRSENPEVEFHGKESLNFQITASLAVLVLVVMTGFFMIFAAIPLLGLLFWIPIAFLALAGAVIALGTFILTIIATIKASSGKHYRYPFSIRFVK